LESDADTRTFTATELNGERTHRRGFHVRKQTEKYTSVSRLRLYTYTETYTMHISGVRASRWRSLSFTDSPTQFSFSPYEKCRDHLIVCGLLEHLSLTFMNEETTLSNLDRIFMEWSEEPEALR